VDGVALLIPPESDEMVTTRLHGRVQRLVHDLGVTYDPLPDTWTERDLPVLLAALRRSDAGEFPSLEEIRQEVGLSVDQMRVSVDALRNALPPYFEVTLYSMGPDVMGGVVDGVGERARRELGTWPTSENVVDEIVRALQRAAETEPEPERRTRLRTIADGLGGFARDVAVGVVSTKPNGL
jgi:hypothetical protein